MENNGGRHEVIPDLEAKIVRKQLSRRLKTGDVVQVPTISSVQEEEDLCQVPSGCHLQRSPVSFGRPPPGTKEFDSALERIGELRHAFASE